MDRVRPDMIWAFLESHRVDGKLIIILKSIYKKAKAAVRVGADLGE